MTRPIVLTLLACLCALPLLSGCGEKYQVRPTPAIEVPVPAYRPLDAKLTAPIAEPAPPPARCTLLGVPVVCALDGLAQIEQWRGKLQQCNADRATSAQVTKPPGE